MKRNIFLSTLAAISFVAVPAIAQTAPGHGPDYLPDYAPDYRANKRDHTKPVFVPPQIKPQVPIRVRPVVKSFSPTSAIAGSTVTIKGHNFRPGTQILLNNKIIAPTKLNAKRIKFVIPSGATDGAISLLMPNRRRTLAVGMFDVVVPPPPTPTYGGYGFDNDFGWYRTRSNRRASSRRGIMSRWNRMFLRSPAAQAELTAHAKRQARLKRIKRLAKNYQNGRLLARVNRAIKRENRRHDRKMKKLQSTFTVSYRVNPYQVTRYTPTSTSLY